MADLMTTGHDSAGFDILGHGLPSGQSMLGREIDNSLALEIENWITEYQERIRTSALLAQKHGNPFRMHQFEPRGTAGLAKIATVANSNASQAL
jgi:hypothetical protein